MSIDPCPAEFEPDELCVCLACLDQTVYMLSNAFYVSFDTLRDAAGSWSTTLCFMHSNSKVAMLNIFLTSILMAPIIDI